MGIIFNFAKGGKVGIRRFAFAFTFGFAALGFWGLTAMAAEVRADVHQMSMSASVAAAENHVKFKADSVVPAQLQKEVRDFLWSRCRMFSGANEEALFSIQELETQYYWTVMDQYQLDENYTIRFWVSYDLDGYHPGSQTFEQELVVTADQFGPHSIHENPALFCF